MDKILITSDSTCALPRKEAAEIGLPILPLNVIIDGIEYHDGIDIDQERLCPMMRNGSVIKTSTPTLFEIESFFDEQFAKGYDHIIHFTISSRLSSMFDLFTSFCREKYGNKVTIIDSKSVCTYMLNTVLSAMEYVKQGLQVEEILPLIYDRINTEDIFFIPESLTFLKRGGRVSPTVALIGNMIGMKPILSVVDGAIEKSSTTRNIKKAIEAQLILFASKEYPVDQWEIHIVTFDTLESLVDFTKKTIEHILPGYEVKVTPISINVCAHAGPGTIGIGMTRKPTR